MKFVAFSIFAALSGCVSMDFSTARSVQTKPGKGGVLTLNPPSDPKARAKADEIMHQTCAAKKAEITEEGEAVVGTTTNSNTEHNSGGGGGIKVAGLGFGSTSPSTNSESTQKQLTEWRITYECK
ncbi:MAG: hypothetical protein NTV34_00365 [Proteobacteria bacterium]|nr:hypothetical protein [Pseudomonadota bacterium]